MSNAKLIGEFPKDRTIAEMDKGESGYAVFWAYNLYTECLDTAFTIQDKKAGTAYLRVKCLNVGLYEVEVEEPSWRSPILCRGWEYWAVRGALVLFIVLMVLRCSGVIV